MPNILKFPAGFLWGSAVSAYQVEGGIENSDWSRDYPAGKACDYYNQYERYFDMAKDLNQNIHRFSLEWSRIEPKEGKFDREAVEHYKKILLALRARGIKSMVTIWHWTNPIWFSAKGGWENSKSPEYFEKFVKFIVPELDDLVDFWITLNEPTIFVLLGYLEGRFPPYGKSIFPAAKVFINLLKAHKVTYREIHRFNKNSKAGIAYNFIYISFAGKMSILNNILVKLWHYFSNHLFIDLISKDLDYLGCNYYFHEIIEFTPQKFPFIRVNHEARGIVSDINWEIFPEGIYHVLKDLYLRYNLPIYVTENGVADAKDALRSEFIISHLKWMHKAISEEVDVKGYLYWSLLDNFEWTYGFSKRFGLIEMDFDTLEAKIRPSALKYAKVCKNNSLIV